MSVYPPPTENVPIFNPDNWTFEDQASLSIAEGDTRYLRKTITDTATGFITFQNAMSTNEIIGINGNINIGTSISTSNIIIGNPDANIVFFGNTTIINVDQLTVKDKNITVNENGITPLDAGILVESNGNIVSSFLNDVNADWILSSSNNRIYLDSIGEKTANATITAINPITVDEGDGGLTKIESAFVCIEQGSDRGGMKLTPAIDFCIGTFNDLDLHIKTNNINRLDINGLNGNITINSTLESTSSNTGALVVNGGLGVVGNIFTNKLTATSRDPYEATFYVSKQGNDTTGTGSMTNPYLTITQALTVGMPLYSKLCVMVAAGQYDEDLTIPQVASSITIIGEALPQSDFNIRTTDMYSTILTGNLTITGSVDSQISFKYLHFNFALTKKFSSSGNNTRGPYIIDSCLFTRQTDNEAAELMNTTSSGLYLIRNSNFNRDDTVDNSTSLIISGAAMNFENCTFAGRIITGGLIDVIGSVRFDTCFFLQLSTSTTISTPIIRTTGSTVGRSFAARYCTFDTQRGGILDNQKTVGTTFFFIFCELTAAIGLATTPNPFIFMNSESALVSPSLRLVGSVFTQGSAATTRSRMFDPSYNILTSRSTIQDFNMADFSIVDLANISGTGNTNINISTTGTLPRNINLTPSGNVNITSGNLVITGNIIGQSNANISGNLGVTGNIHADRLIATSRGPYEATFYVSKQGNNTTGTGSESNPFLTIQEAIDTGVAQAYSKIGVYVSTGTYTEDISFPNNVYDITLFSYDADYLNRFAFTGSLEQQSQVVCTGNIIVAGGNSTRRISIQDITFEFDLNKNFTSNGTATVFFTNCRISSTQVDNLALLVCGNAHTYLYQCQVIKLPTTISTAPGITSSATLTIDNCFVRCNSSVSVIRASGTVNGYYSSFLNQNVSAAGQCFIRPDGSTASRAFYFIYCNIDVPRGGFLVNERSVDMSVYVLQCIFGGNTARTIGTNFLFNNPFATTITLSLSGTIWGQDTGNTLLFPNATTAGFTIVESINTLSNFNLGNSNITNANSILGTGNADISISTTGTLIRDINLSPSGNVNIPSGNLVVTGNIIGSSILGTGNANISISTTGTLSSNINLTSTGNIEITANDTTGTLNFIGTNLESNVAGSNSGLYLRIILNGTPYKISLEDDA